jgi:uracil-DNA glycosylase family 4
MTASNHRADALRRLNAETADCRLCPRLVAWREQMARVRRAAYAQETYWGRPVPGFGDPDAWLLIVGLAPGAHGSNRTGRPFTGDRSGDWLFASLHRAALASQPLATASDDGLRLLGAYLTACVRCAPPANKPRPEEWEHCRPHLARELDILDALRVAVCLGQFAWDRLLRLLRDRGLALPRPLPRFGHGVQLQVGSLTVIASYHPSQQNTFTGKLTEAMLDDVWAAAWAARKAADGG